MRTSGTLPAGLTLSPTSGLISGTPTQAGTAHFTVTATDAAGDVGRALYTIRVNPALTIATADLPGWDVDQPGYSQSITARGGTASLTFTVASGALPVGLSLDPGTGSLGGTPQATGTFNFTIGVTDAAGATVTQSYTVQVAPPPVLATANLASGDVGTKYSQALPVTGGTGPFTFEIKHPPPSGPTLNTHTGILSGTPGAAGTFSFTVTVVDAAGMTAAQSYTVTINPPPTITPAHLLAGEPGATYTQTFAATGGTAPYTLQALDSPPPGLTFDPTSGVLTGNPTVAGTFPFTVVVTDQAGATVRKNYSVVIDTVLAVPVAVKPAYLQTVTDPTFGTQITRIAADAGAPIVTADGTTIGTWSRDARHNYSINEAWNSNSTLIMIENRGDAGGTPDQLYLNGSTYQVEFGTPSNMPGNGSDDQRWNQNPDYPDDVLLAGDGSNTLYWFNVVTNTVDRTYALPIPITYMGNTDGNASQNGQYICLGDLTHFFILDMNAYPTERIGPIFDLSSLGIDGTVDSYSISPSGNYVVVTYNELDGQAGDFEQVLQVNPTTLALSPQPMSVSWPGMVGNPALGFVYDVGHQDMALDPFLNNADVMIGQEQCGNVGLNIPGIATVNSDGIGHVVMVQLSNGAVTSLTDPGNGTTIADEAYADHVSCRNVDRPGWCYVSYYNEPGDRFSDEIVAVSMDGSGTVEQLADYHSDNDDNNLPEVSVDPDFAYRSEAHPVPSPDGQRVIFASNWLYETTGGEWIQDYVVELPQQQASPTATADATSTAEASPPLLPGLSDALFVALIALHEHDVADGGLIQVLVPPSVGPRSS